MAKTNNNALKAVFAFLCLAVLASQLWAMSRWNEARGVYDDICYLRQAHLFQRFGLAGLETDISHDDDHYLTSKLKEIGYPGWSNAATAPCHMQMQRTGKLVIQYPPGVGMVLALFPQGRQVIPMYMLTTVAMFGFALLAIFLARTASSTILAGAFGCLVIYMMINPAKASYSMAPTMVVCALAGFLTARWLAGPQRDARIGLIVAVGFLLGLTVNFRVANLVLASGYFLLFLVSFLASRKALPFLQGALFTASFVVGMAPTLISNAINAGSPFVSTYGNNPEVQPFHPSIAVISQYFTDPMQVGLVAAAIAATIYLLSRGDGVRRVVLVTAVNLALNVAFFLTYSVATPYYMIPIAMLSLWSLLFAFLMQKTQTVEDAVGWQAARAAS